MKKILYLFTISILLFSCSNITEKREGRDSINELVTDLNQSVMDGDVDKFRTLFLFDYFKHYEKNEDMFTDSPESLIVYTAQMVKECNTNSNCYVNNYELVKEYNDILAKSRNWLLDELEVERNEDIDAVKYAELKSGGDFPETKRYQYLLSMVNGIKEFLDYSENLKPSQYYFPSKSNELKSIDFIILKVDNKYFIQLNSNLETILNV